MKTSYPLNSVHNIRNSFSLALNTRDMYASFWWSWIIAFLILDTWNDYHFIPSKHHVHKIWGSRNGFLIWSMFRAHMICFFAGNVEFFMLELRLLLVPLERWFYDHNGKDTLLNEFTIWEFLSKRSKITSSLHLAGIISALYMHANEQALPEQIGQFLGGEAGGS